MRHVVDDAWDALPSAGLAADADALVAYARRQQVSEYLLRRIDTAQRRALFPPVVITGLEAETSRLSHVTDRLPAVLGEVVDTLADADIDTRVLKGRPFAQLYFGDPDLRRQVDVDVLVPIADVNRALRALWAIGFRTKPRRVDLVETGPILRAGQLRTEHAVAARRDRLNVDLHWSLRNAPAYRVPERAVWAASLSVEVDGRTYRTLDHEYAVVLLLLSIAHDIGRCACRLKHVLDVHQWLRRRHDATDWRRFFERRAEENTLGVCVNALHVALDVFDSRATFAALDNALSAHAARRVAWSADESIELMHGGPGRAANAVWLADAYPLSLWRDAAWMIERTVTHPGRIPVSLWRAGRFACRLGWYAMRHGPARLRR